jgi:hypothetical protein
LLDFSEVASCFLATPRVVGFAAVARVVGFLVGRTVFATRLGFRALAEDFFVIDFSLVVFFVFLNSFVLDFVVFPLVSDFFVLAVFSFVSDFFALVDFPFVGNVDFLVFEGDFFVFSFEGDFESDFFVLVDFPFVGVVDFLVFDGDFFVFSFEGDFGVFFGFFFEFLYFRW